MSYFSKKHKTNLDADHDLRICHDTAPDDLHIS